MLISKDVDIKNVEIERNLDIERNLILKNGSLSLCKPITRTTETNSESMIL